MFHPYFSSLLLFLAFPYPRYHFHIDLVSDFSFDLAPDFTADSTSGKLKWHEYIDGKWAILFSHPRQSTPVCTTELGQVAKLKDEWAKRGVVVAAMAIDTVEDNKKWINDINEINKTKVDYPIIGDHDYQVSLLYGMVDKTHVNSQTGMPYTIRSVYFIGPDKKIKAIISYPASTGRSFKEVLRVVDSLQLAESHKVATPADWQKGDTCVVLPSVSTEEAQKIFPKGVNVIRPWMRTTPDPSV